jgi:hypothetical protein
MDSVEPTLYKATVVRLEMLDGNYALVALQKGEGANSMSFQAVVPPSLGASLKLGDALSITVGLWPE